MIKRAGMAIAACSLMVVALSVWSLKAVSVVLPKEAGRLIYATIVDQDDEIRLRYRHSVELTWVEGLFKVDQNARLLAIETKMESVGTGLPNTASDRTRLEDGQIVVDEKYQPLASLRFYLVPINQTRLMIAGQKVHIDDLEEGTLIEIAARNVSALKWLLWRYAAIPFNK